MRPRYLLLARTGAGDSAALLDVLHQRTGFTVGFSNAGIAAFVNRDCRCIPVAGRGCVVGTLFRRDGPAEPVGSFTPAEAASIADSSGDALLSRFWGGYVAAMAGSGAVTILRDPSAACPCYFARGAGYAAFASDAELLVESGLSGVEIDWGDVAGHFFRAGVPTPATSLRGISELLPGFSIAAQGGTESQVPRWSPWDLVRESAGDRDAAAERLSRTVKHCVRAWAAGRGRLLLSVSGGLDSSIVAAALSDAGADVTCVTMYDSDPSGDERPFARALCARLGLPLIERPYRLDDIDITEPLGPHLPRSEDRSQALAYERAHLEVAREIGADAFVTGNGGDSVFGYSQSAAPIADRLLSRSSWRAIVETLLDVCRQTGCSLLDAAARGWALARGPRGYLCRPNPLFLRQERLLELRGTPLEHPWLNAPPDALPGKAAHIAAILRVQQAFEPHRSRSLAVLNPLFSQPIIECCLAIPTWEWREGGIDRSVARRAFADDLPPVILQRRIKGGPGSFAARILDDCRGAIRERLLDGQLARHGIIDTGALWAALADGRFCTDDERVRILEFVAAEAWLDCWISRSQRIRDDGDGDVRTALERRASS